MQYSPAINISNIIFCYGGSPKLAKLAKKIQITWIHMLSVVIVGNPNGHMCIICIGILLIPYEVIQNSHWILLLHHVDHMCTFNKKILGWSVCIWPLKFTWEPQKTHDVIISPEIRFGFYCHVEPALPLFMQHMVKIVLK